MWRCCRRSYAPVSSLKRVYTGGIVKLVVGNCGDGSRETVLCGEGGFLNEIDLSNGQVAAQEALSHAAQQVRREQGR